MSAALLLFLRTLMGALLYGFIIYALWLLWQDLRRATPNTLLSPPPLTLHLQHPQTPITRTFTHSPILLGRDPACHLVLTHATVSAHHCRLTYHSNQWWAEDLQTTNGTFLNDQPLTTPTVITHTDTLRCGNVSVSVTVSVRVS